MLLYCAIFLFVGSLNVPTSHSVPLDYNFECRGLPENFLFWWACGSYGVCRGGSYVQVDCVNGTSYDRVLGDCRDNSQGVNFPCNRQPSCQDYDGPGHRYPEMDRDDIENLPSCTFYYTCSYNRYLGHQRCNQGTVYDQSHQICNRPDRVPPPCGTYTGDDAGNPFRGREGFVIDEDGNAVIALPVDNEGNADQDQWPYTNNNNNNNRGSQRRTGNQPQPQQPFRQTFRGGPQPSRFSFTLDDHRRRFSNAASAKH